MEQGQIAIGQEVSLGYSTDWFLVDRNQGNRLHVRSTSDAAGSLGFWLGVQLIRDVRWPAGTRPARES